jgi:hypothetical protein
MRSDKLDGGGLGARPRVRSAVARRRLWTGGVEEGSPTARLVTSRAGLT